MSDFLIFSLALWLLAVPALVLVLRFFFKKSLVFTIGLIWLICQTVIVHFAYGVGSLGKLTDLLWAFPIGFIATVIGFFVLNLLVRKSLESVERKINHFSSGNLNIRIDPKALKRQDEIGRIFNAILSLSKTFTNISTSIKSTSEHILSTGQQLSASSEELSQGASEQASSFEEVSSTMEEIAANIEQNLSNSQKTNEISSSAEKDIIKVSEASGESLNFIKKISEKITIINDIAFQTNILALNAAVEAARAGEHGKGFAVVANEVKKLAENSKKAADEIIELSGTSESVTQTVEKLMSALKPDIEKTSGLVQEITSASMEQTNGANQVNDAIQKLNSVTQQFAASSEEIASNAISLSDQAAELKREISFFKTE